MGKNPAFQFYPGDWTRDLDDQDLEIEGAWIRVICRLWWSEKRGEATKPLKEWARILRKTEQKTIKIFQILIEKHIADGSILDNQNITIISRRMVSDDRLSQIRRISGSLGGNPSLLKIKNNLVKQNASKSQPLLLQSSSSTSNIFIIPELSEIRAYCLERKNKVDPESFFNFYESKGWLIGKNKMKNWKAAINTWEKNNFNNTSPQPQPKKQVDPFTNCPVCGARSLKERIDENGCWECKAKGTVNDRTNSAI